MRKHSPPYLTLFLVLLTVSSHASTYFVRAGASGNGTSWANAWGDLNNIAWASLNAGDTVCIAGGTYRGNLTTGKSGTSGNPITVKRALASDAVCGSTTTEWNAAFDSQVVMTGTMGIRGSFVTIDGAVFNGIQVVMQNPTNSYQGITGNGVTDSITLRNIEVAGPCPNGVLCHQNAIQTGLSASSWNGSSYNVQSNWLLQYMNIHGGCQNIQVFGGTNWTIEHSRFADSDDTTGVPCHPNVFYNGDSSNMTFRYNEVVNWGTEGIMFNGSIGNWYFYGNIWHDAATNSYPRVMAANGATNVGPLLAYNNSYVNCGSNCIGAIHVEQGGSYAAGSVSYNNVYWNTPISTDITNDYDLADVATGETHGQNNAANPFVNLGAHTVAGYNLKAHTNPGATLGFPYNIDYSGNTRTTWDRGAFEFNSGSATLPAPPTNLTAIIQ